MRDRSLAQIDGLFAECEARMVVGMELRVVEVISGGWGCAGVCDRTTYFLAPVVRHTIRQNKVP